MAARRTQDDRAILKLFSTDVVIGRPFVTLRVIEIGHGHARQALLERSLDAAQVRFLFR